MRTTSLTVAAGARVRPRLTLGLLSAQHALIHAQTALLPLVFIEIASTFRVGPQAIGLLVATASVSAGLVQLSFGSLTRRLSRRAMLGSGGLLFGAATAGMAAASGWAPFFATGVLSRLGSSPQHAVGNALLAEQFPARRRGLAISLHVALANVVPVAVPLVGSWLIVTAGWQAALLAVGLPALVVAVAILLLVRETGTDRATARGAGSTAAAFRALAADRDLRWLFAASSVAAAGRGQGVLVTFLPLYLALQLHLPATTVALMYTLLLAGSVPAPIIAGWVSDRIGHKTVLLAAYLLGAASTGLLVVAGTSVPFVWVAVGFMGAFVFEESALLQALLADVARPALRDVAFSAYFTLMFVVSAAWQATIGMIIGALGDGRGYAVAFSLMAASFLAAALVALPIRAPEAEG